MPSWSPRKEFCVSSLVFLCFAAIYFQKPLRSTWISQVGPVKVAAGEGLVGASEAVYHGYPPYYFAAEQIRRGRLPLWSPYAGGGVPFIGNMQSGALSPLHLMFYLVPDWCFQYLWMALFVLCFYIGWAPTFVLARWHGIAFPGAIFAAACYTFSSTMVNYNIESPGQTAIYTPALFLMAEQFLRGDRRKALLWLPWLIALPVLSGHFQVSFYAWVSIGIYVLCNSSRRDVIKNALVFAGLAVWGLALAAGQIVTGLEYISRSYTKVWRTLPEYGWTLRRISKPLVSDDAPCLILAAAGFMVFLWCLKRLKKDDLSSGWSWLYYWGGGFAALSLCIAGLMSTGMLSPVFLLPRYTLNYPELSHYTPGMILCAALFFLSLFASLDAQCPRPLKIMGWLAVVGLLLYLKTPLLIHAFYNLPFLKTTYLDNYNTSIQLGLALLGSYGLGRLAGLMGQDWAERKRALYGAARLALLLVAACAASEYLENPLSARLGVGVNPELERPASGVGGIADAGKRLLMRSRYTIRGWFPGNPQAISVGFQQGNNNPSLSPAAISAERGSVFFEKELALPEGASVPVALVVDSSGQQKLWRGSELTKVEGPALWAALGLLAVPCVALLFLFLPARARPLTVALCYLSVIVYIGQLSSVAFVGANDDNLQTVWPGVEKLKQDGGIYRIHSFDQYLYPAALSSIQGIADIRNGSDVLDVVTIIHYLQLAGSLFQAGVRQNQDWGGQILGVGNIKYLLARPNQPLPEKGLELIHKGQDMLVYRNKDFMERVKFYDNWKYIDGAPLDHWQQARNVLAPIYQGIINKKLDMRRELLLNEAPPAPYSWAQETKPSRSETEVLGSDIDRITASVKTDNPGFLFFSSNYYPGWKAYVDGQPAKILRSWVSFCAVPVPAGRHVVHFVYDSLRINASLILSALAALAWLAWWVRSLTRPAAPPTPPNMPEPVLPKKAAKRGRRDNPEIMAPLPSYGGFPFIDICLSVFMGTYFLFWLNWSAWIYGGGLLPKAAAAVQIILGGKKPADFGYLGAPYAMGVFEGWTVNLIAAAALAALGAAGMLELRKRFKQNFSGF